MVNAILMSIVMLSHVLVLMSVLGPIDSIWESNENDPVITYTRVRARTHTHKYKHIAGNSLHIGMRACMFM